MPPAVKTGSWSFQDWVPKLELGNQKSAKLAAQQRLLLRAVGQRPELRKPLLDGAGQLRALLSDCPVSIGAPGKTVLGSVP